MHLVLHQHGARPLDGRYVVATNDIPRRGDRCRRGPCVLRHYTSPVRHKFWLALR